MKYALLLYDNPDAWQNVGEDELKELHGEYMAVAGEPEAYGGAQLGPAERAKVVRGELVTDGPFTETKEVLSGFYLVDADSKERALELALRVPTVSRMGGAIEVRPLVER
jgi:hypothetical protein